MFAARTAAISLMALIATSLPVSVRPQAGARNRGAERSATQSAQRSTTQSVDVSYSAIPSARLSPLPSSTPTRRWKKRDRLLVGKATQIRVDDLDLGPALLPTQPSRSAPLELIDLRPLTAPRLRC